MTLVHMIPTRLRIALAAATACMGMAGCFPTDVAIAPVDRGGAVTQSVGIGSMYADRAYIDLTDGSVVRMQPVTSWHLSFGCSGTDLRVELNNGLFGKLQSTGTTVWEDVVLPAKARLDTIFTEPRYDMSSGTADSLAIGHLFTAGGTINDTVFIFDLGIGTDVFAKPLGMRKIQLVAATQSAYTLRCSNIDGTADTVYTVNRDPNYEFIGLNLITREIVRHEPPAGTWDVVLSRYTTILGQGDTAVPYVVTGILLSQQARGIRTKDLAFQTATAADTMRFPLVRQRDIIGYDWKNFFLEPAPGFYVTDTSTVFMVEDRRKFLRAWRFLDFYDSKGAKGTATYTLRLL